MVKSKPPFLFHGKVVKSLSLSVFKTNPQVPGPALHCYIPWTVLFHRDPSPFLGGGPDTLRCGGHPYTATSLGLTGWGRLPISGALP